MGFSISSGENHILIHDVEHRITCVRSEPLRQNGLQEVEDAPWYLFVTITGATRANIAEIVGDVRTKEEGDTLRIRVTVEGPQASYAVVSRTVLPRG